jgi:hypothetical protein
MAEAAAAVSTREEKTVRWLKAGNKILVMKTLPSLELGWTHLIQGENGNLC